MAKNTQKAQASTQKFTQLEDIVDDIVILEGGNACLIIEVSSTNFALLSGDEQEAKIEAYAAFLNSLTFTIQILINNRRVNITSYITLLDSEINKLDDPIIIQYMQLYKSFIQQLVKQNIVLDKRFYIVIPYSFLEAGAVKTISTATQATIRQSGQDTSLIGARANLHSKADGIRNQLARINLQTKILQRDEIIKLFHQMYNPENSVSAVPNMLNTSQLNVDKNISKEK